MKLFKSYKLFIESLTEVQNDLEKPKNTYKPDNIISEICVSMVLLNNQFLDNLLDKGLKARYSENSQVFITDLKNILMAKNRLNLGKFQDDKFVSDEETSKINGIFESVDFSIEENWNDLVNARITARNIIDKLLVDEKLTDDLIRKIYWIGPNKSKDINEDIVIEATNGKQYSFYLNKKLNATKTASFNSFADDLIGDEYENLHSEEYTPKWDKLIQNWVKIIYENANKNFQIHIEKFIDPTRMDSLDWFQYFNLKHKDLKFRNLGEHIREFDKNILYLSDLMNEIWKNRESCFLDQERVYKEWIEKKIFLLNSKILEHILTDSLTKNNLQEIKKLDNGFKEASGKVKMKLIKSIVDKLGCLERTIYYLGNKGNDFYQVPSRQFFREFYDDLKIKFDYHVKLVIKEEEEQNNFLIKLRMELDEQPFIDCDIIVKFTGGEISSKLSATYKIEPSDNFNLLVLNKIKKYKDED